MQDLFNFTDANGEVIMLFDGKMTLSQLVVIIIAIAVVLIALKVIKTAMRAVVCVVAVCFCLVYFNIASPDQLKDVAGQIASAGVSGYQTVIDSSQNIKWEDNSIKVNVEGKWINASDIESIVGGDSGKATIVANGNTYVVDDSAVIQLLKMFT